MLCWFVPHPLQLLLPWRMHHDLTHAPELLVVKKGAAGEAVALVVQAHSGAVLQELQVPAEGVDQVSCPGCRAATCADGD